MAENRSDWGNKLVLWGLDPERVPKNEGSFDEEDILEDTRKETKDVLDFNADHWEEGIDD